MAGSPQFPKLRVGGDVSRTQDNIAQQVDPIARVVAATPMLNGAAPAWVKFSLVNGYANSGTIAPASRYKDSFLRVHMQGFLVHAAGCAGGTVLTVLPRGERPTSFQLIVVQGTAVTYQAILINPNGNVTNEAGIAAGGTIWLGGSFLADG